MFFVQVRLNSVDLLAHMSQMRIWLDAARLVGFRQATGEAEFGRGRQQRRRRNANDGTGSR